MLQLFNSADLPYRVPGLVGDWNPDLPGALTLTDPAPAFAFPLDISNAAWAKNRVTVAAVTDPFGGSNAYEMTETAFTDSHYVGQTPSPTPIGGGLHEVSAYFKAGTRSWAYLATNSAATYAFFNVSTGQLGIKHVNIVDHQMIDVGSGWWFCRMWGKYTAATACRAGMSTTDGLFSYLGDGSTLSVYSPGIQAKLIAQIKDAKGGRHATQSTDSAKPLWCPDYWAPGRGGILTDGASSFMVADAVATSAIFHGVTTPVCRYFVQFLTPSGGAVNDFLSPAFGRSTSTSASRHDLFVSGGSIIGFSRINDAGTNSGGALTPSSVVDNLKNYWSDRFTGSQRIPRRSGVGVAVAEAITGAWTPDYFTFFAFRHSAGPTVQGWVGGWHGRHLMYNQSVSEADNFALEVYMRDQYGMTPPLLTQVTDTYFSGTPTFTTPSSVWSPTWVKNQVFPQCWGSGAGGTTDTGSGGGGAFAGTPAYNVLPSTGYAVSVAAGGAVTADGADSTFDTGGVVARGGLASAGGSTGGVAAACTGTIRLSGGNGVVGTGTRVGGGGSGNKVFGNLSTGGADSSMSNSSAAVMTIGGGGFSTAASQAAGKRGEVRVAYCIEAPTGFPYQPYPPSTGRDPAVDATTRNIAAPPGNGGILLVYVSSDGAPTIDMPGWNKLGELADGTSVTASAWFWIDASQGDPTAFAVTTSSSQQVAWQCERWYGAGTPEIATATGSSTNANPPSLTYSGGSKKIVWKVTAGLDTNASPEFTAVPTGFTSMITVNGTGTGGAAPMQAVAERFLEAATLDPDPFGSTSEQWVCATIAIPPA